MLEHLFVSIYTMKRLDEVLHFALRKLYRTFSNHLHGQI